MAYIHAAAAALQLCNIEEGEEEGEMEEVRWGGVANKFRQEERGDRWHFSPTDSLQCITLRL